MPEPHRLPPPPAPGLARQIADATGAVIGIEVWTGAAWLPLAHVAMVSTADLARSHAFTQATVVLARVLPASAEASAA